MNNINKVKWQQVNNALNAKIFSELHYEELLIINKLNINDSKNVIKQRLIVETAKTKQGVELPVMPKNEQVFQWVSGDNIWKFSAKGYLITH